MIIELEYLLINSNKDKKEASQEHSNLNNAIEAETKTITKQGLVTDVVTPLNTISIVSQDDRSNIQKKLSKQTTTSASLLLNKGKRPQA